MEISYWLKDLSIDFVTRLLIFINERSEIYDLLLVIINRLPKIVYYKSVKISIHIFSLPEVIINTIVTYHCMFYLGLSDCVSVFILMFWFLLCYLLKIKQKLSTPFYSQTDGQIKRQISTIEVYLWVFIKFKKSD